MPAYQRPLDVVLGMLLLAVSLPLWLIVTLVVKATSPGPVLFRQERLGILGRRFTVYKFRTMFAGVESAPHEEYFKQYMRGEVSR